MLLYGAQCENTTLSQAIHALGVFDFKERFCLIHFELIHGFCLVMSGTLLLVFHHIKMQFHQTNVDDTKSFIELP